MTGIGITACGVLSPWGTGLEPFAGGLADRTPTIRGLQDPGGVGGQRGGIVTTDPATLLPRTRGLREFDRTSLLLAAATALALGDSGEAVHRHDDVGLAVGTTFGTIGCIINFDTVALADGPLYTSPLAFPNTVLNAPAGRIASLFGVRGVNATISTGETSGLDALIYGTEWLAAGRAACLLVGSAFGLTPDLAAAFPAVLGEGAAMFAVEPLERVAARGDRVHAQVAGFGTVFLPHGLPAGPVAEAALRDVLAAAGVVPADVDVVVVGERAPDGHPGLEAATLAAVLGRRPTVGFTELLGDCLDASGSLALVAALCALDEGARTVLVSAFSRQGNASFVVLGAVERGR